MRRRTRFSAVSLISTVVTIVVVCPLYAIVCSAQSGQPAVVPVTSRPTPASTSPQKKDADIVAHDTTIFKVRVTQVLLNVVVRGKDGKTVGNLPRDAFRVLDNGNAQPITSFSVTASGSASRPFSDGHNPAVERRAIIEPQRYIAFLFDDLHVDIADLMRVKDAASQFVTTSIIPVDRAAIFTLSGRVTLDFTDNREVLLKTIAQIQPAPLMQDDLESCPRMNYYLADQIMNKHNSKLESLLIDDTIKCLDLLPNATAVAKDLVRSTASRVLTAGDADVQISFSLLRDIISRLSSAPGQRSIMLTSPGFFTPDTQASQLTPLFRNALHSNVVINTLDVRGLWIDPEMTAQTNRKPVFDEPIMQQYMHQAAVHQSDVLAELADGTGGTLVQNTNDLLAGFRRATAVPEFSYRLSFTPQDLKADGKFHNLKVIVSNPPGLTARTQKGYFAPSRTRDAAEETKSDIEDAVFSRDERQEIPIDLHTQFFKANDNQASVAVLTHVDLRHLTFRKQADRNLNTVTVVSVLFDRNGRFVSGQEKTIEFHMRDESMQRHLRDGLAVKSNFDVKPGDYLVRVVVRDTEGQLLSARNDTVSIP